MKSWGIALLPWNESLSPGNIYLLFKPGHAWAVVNGRFLDRSPHSSRYTHAFLVLPNPEGDKTESMVNKAKAMAAKLYLND